MPYTSPQLLLLILLGTGFFSSSAVHLARAQETFVALGTSELDELSPEERVNVSVYETANRSVVHITTKMVHGDQRWFREVPATGNGSGSVLDRQGHILTNNHVIEDARSAMVALYNGKSFPAQLVGRDESLDLAVLKIDAPSDVLYPIQPGDSSRLRVGQKAFAIGNPFGLERTLTIGIISSLNRTLDQDAGRVLRSMIQVDAALNRGNSGGPLLDSRGRLIGMNTAIASSTGENTGIGFAIPSNTIFRAVPELIQLGHVEHPDAGLQLYETEEGLLVILTTPRGPAERAGIRGFKVIREQQRLGAFLSEKVYLDRSQADLVLGLNGERVTTEDEFYARIDQFHPGDTVTLAIRRDGQVIAVPLRLEMARGKGG